MQTETSSAERIRQLLIETASAKGGHLASNLGIVELTLALMDVYDFAHDVIVFDIGHQSHPYKILTGRDEAFPAIGERSGIANFPDIFESPFDYYSTGHSGTAVSAALAYSVVRTDAKSIAIIGDGSLTTGETFEALNHAGQMQTNLLVIYNENGMAISKNVGALAEGRRLKAFAESLCFEYRHLENGHDVEALRAELREIRSIHRPVFFHVTTVKGKGFPFAERDPEAFHWTPPFDVESGEPKWTLSSPFVDKLVELADEIVQERSPAYFTTPAYGCWAMGRIAEKHPRQVIDTGINEQHCVTFSSALALAGATVVMHLAEWFLPRCVDQIVDACIQRARMTVLLSFGGIGFSGPSHDGRYSLSILNAIPNVTLLAPRDVDDFEEMLRHAFSADGTVFIRMPDVECTGGNRGPSGTKARLLTDGSRLTLVSIGGFYDKCMELTRTQEGIELVHLRWLKPFDGDVLARSVAKTGRLLVLENGMKKGGIGEDILAYLVESGVSCRARILAAEDAFVGHGSPPEVLADNGLSDEHVRRAVRFLMED